jgi:hypothetical protein
MARSAPGRGSALFTFRSNSVRGQACVASPQGVCVSCPLGGNCSFGEAIFAVIFPPMLLRSQEETSVNFRNRNKEKSVNDAERLSQHPTFRLIGSEKIWDRGAALPSRLHWFETEVLSQDENLDGLSRINRELIAKAEAMDLHERVVLDMDSTEIPVYVEHEQSAYNLGNLWRKERCCKSGGISGNFGGAGSALGPSSAVRMRIVSQCREQAGWVYDRCRFRGQKGNSG